MIIKIKLFMSINYLDTNDNDYIILSWDDIFQKKILYLLKWYIYVCIYIKIHDYI